MESKSCAGIKKITILLFFMAYLFVGIAIFRDYGISWDEPTSIFNGQMTLNYVLKGDQTLVDYKYKYHGAIFDVLLIAIGRILNLADSRVVYLIRHLVTFLFFYIGAFFFYLLVKLHFNSWRMGLLGALFLILSPRIFADSFYNPKDIPFLSVFIISIFTLFRYLSNKVSLKASLFHALSCAFLIGIRVVGIIVPLFTIFFFFADWLIIKPMPAKAKKAFFSFLVYISFLVIFTVLFWPVLWIRPLYHFIQAFIQMAHYPQAPSTLYMGNYVNPARLPWHYIPVWIIISTPLIYSFCFLFGFFILIKKIFKNPPQFYTSQRNDLIFILWFFLPLVTAIIFKLNLYDAWRHLFYIYPAFLILALTGVTFLFRLIKIKFPGKGYQILRAALVFIIAASLMNVAKFMVKYHPYQNIYFNILAGKDMQEVKRNFELDYWGLSYKKVLEYILRNDKDWTIKIFVANDPGRKNSFILNKDDRERLFFVNNQDEAKYFISNYRWHNQDYPYAEYYSVKIDGAKIVTAYKLK